MALKVLLADDDKMAVFLQELIIKDSILAGEIHSFENGRDTLDFLEADHNTGDGYLLFLDNNMPIMSGQELMIELAKKPYADRVNVALVSSYSPMDDEAARANFKQIVYIYEKPVTADTCKILVELPEVAKFLDISHA